MPVINQAHGSRIPVLTHIFSFPPLCADDCSSNINAFCSIDEAGRKPVSQMTLGEKEQAFLEALSVSAPGRPARCRPWHRGLWFPCLLL